MLQQAARVVAVDQIAEHVHVIRLFADRIAPEVSPGQFVHVQCGTDREFILRRPFSVHAVSGSAMELIFDVKGKGTLALSRVRQHDVLDVIGPLGNGFSVPQDAKRALLVAGGMGVAPLSMLAQELAGRHVRADIALGAATKARLLRFMELKRLAHEVTVATDDGSVGVKGLVTDLVPALMQSGRPDIVYGCGPEPMLQSLARLMQAYDAPCEISMERLMACGVGACLSCAVRTTEGVVRACAEGPVFDASKVVWQW